MSLEYSGCFLCPRHCGADRSAGKKGFCKMDAKPRVNLFRLHYGEEPCISGEEGSGTVFFEGCSLGCVFCQNYLISRGATSCGMVTDSEGLSDIYMELAGMNANNINLVTPMHWAPDIRDSIILARGKGLKIPVALNISGYDEPDTLKMFDGLCDIYLTDFKFYSSTLSAAVCGASDYLETAVRATDEMVRQRGAPVFDERGMLKSGVIIRHLMLPGQLFDTKKILDLILDRYGDKVIISLMDQYTPMPQAVEACRCKKLPAEFAGRVNPKHYAAMCDYLMPSGHPNCFMQEGDASGDLWIPEFKV